MKKARTTAMLPDFSVRELGACDADEALRAFDAFPWETEVQRASEMDAAGANCVSPSMTVTSLPHHFTATVAARRDAIDVEACVPRRRSLLGLVTFNSASTFEFKSISRRELEELLRAWFSLPADEQFAHFEERRQTLRG